MEQVILKTNHLTKRYGHRAVVENLSMTIHQGDIYGFIGKNGAGKTTLIRMVTGLAAPSDGSIQLFGSGSGRTSSLSPSSRGSTISPTQRTCSSWSV